MRRGAPLPAPVLVLTPSGRISPSPPTSHHRPTLDATIDLHQTDTSLHAKDRDIKERCRRDPIIVIIMLIIYILVNFYITFVLVLHFWLVWLAY